MHFLEIDQESSANVGDDPVLFYPRGLLYFAAMDPYGAGGDTGQNYTQPGGTEFQASPDQRYTGPET